MPVDDLAARHFYGEVLGLEQGRSAQRWIDWNLHGHQFVTHLAPNRFPSFTRLPIDCARPIEFVVEPYIRFQGQPGEQWAMFLLDPAGNALGFKAFADDFQVFAVSPPTREDNG